MKSDTRISIALSLIYVINGIVNSSGTGSFSPLFFIDWFLLAVLAFLFAFLPSFQKSNLFLLLFFFVYLLEGAFTIGWLKSPTFEIWNMCIYISICLIFYVYTIFNSKNNQLLLSLATLMFVTSIALRYFEMPVWVLLSCGGLGALLQVYFLARPDYLSGISQLSKRFILLMILTVYFDIIMHIYFMLNKFPVN